MLAGLVPRFCTAASRTSLRCFAAEAGAEECLKKLSAVKWMRCNSVNELRAECNGSLLAFWQNA